MIQKSSYYNDLCYPYTTEKRTDLTLKDRKKEFVEKNRTLCEEDCEFKGYNTNTKKVDCECPIKVNILTFSQINIDKNKLYDKFTDIRNIMNINLMKCYKLLFTKDGIVYNIGSYIVLCVVILYFISIFVFYKNDLRIINKIIKQILIAKNNMEYSNNSQNNNQKINIKIDKKNKRIKKKGKKRKIKKNNSEKLFRREKNNLDKKRKISTINLGKPNNNLEKDYNIVNIKNSKIKKKSKKKKSIRNIKLENAPPLKKKIGKIKNERSSINFSKINRNISVNDKNTTKKLILSNSLINLKKTENDSIDPSNINKSELLAINNLNDFELNSLEYKEALKKDKRDFFEYYLSLLKTNHLLIFTFFRKNDYNSKIIKIFLFFFSIILFYIVNALFFSDSTIHQILEDGGAFNFIYQIPQIIYSALITNIINIIIKTLSLSEKNILDINQEIDIKNLPKKSDKIIRKLNLKFILFFIISFLFLIFFWYYISCFCAVYKNTRLHLIKDTLISLGLSLIY